MKITIIWKFYTDGDFSLNNYEKYNCIEYDGFEKYFGIKEFKNKDEIQCMIDSRTFLEQMLYDLHVLDTRHYILEDLYEMFEQLIEFVCKLEVGVKIEYMSGNYDGTEIIVVVQNW